MTGCGIDTIRQAILSIIGSVQTSVQQQVAQRVGLYFRVAIK